MIVKRAMQFMDPQTDAALLLWQMSVSYSPYSRIFQSEAATVLSENKQLFIKLGRVSCTGTNYFISIDNFRCSVQLIKIAKRDQN